MHIAGPEKGVAFVTCSESVDFILLHPLPVSHTSAPPVTESRHCSIQLSIVRLIYMVNIE